MNDSFAYRPAGTAVRDRAHTLFAQTMGYVAATAALFALGAYLGRDLTGGLGIVAFIAAFGCLVGMQFAVRRSLGLTVGLLAAFGVLIGLAVAPTLAYYADADPQALWQAGGATALFIAGRLPAAAPLHRHPVGPVHGCVDLPRRAERVPVLPADLRSGERAMNAARGGEADG